MLTAKEKKAIKIDLMNRSKKLREQRSWHDNVRFWFRAMFNPSAANLNALHKSLFFDPEWYLATYTDVAAADMDPVQHYLDHGAAEGRDPSPFFSTSRYLARNPHIAKNGTNPLLHFEGYGWHLRNAKLVDDEEILTDADRKDIQLHIEKLQYKPLISVVMPVYNTPERYLHEAIASVIAQSYPNWEMCIANDASPELKVAQILNEFAEKDKRIRIVHRQTNGNISAATNSALELARGEFIALMDHDDLLHETALYEVAVEINAHPDVDAIYSDEDRIDDNSERSKAYFKTDFNPELFLSQNMISHLGVYRRSLIDKIGGMRVGFEGSQDYDLALRAWGATSNDRIRHIPAILYHWRHSASAPSFSEAQLEKCVESARRAIQEFLDNEGEGAIVIAAPDIGSFSRIVRRIPEPQPLVSVIVPTKDRADLLSVCANGILNQTNYQNLELLIVDHESKEHKTLALFKKLQRDPRVRILPYEGAFNYSAMNNMAAAEAKGSILALVNNDIEVIAPDWLKEMISHAVRPEVGAVGAKLLYPDSRVQHAGVIVGLGGVAGHAFHLLDKWHPGYFFQAVLARAILAVTGACLVMRKAVFFEVNGLNSDDLTVAFNDVDLCLKIHVKGYRNVWTPFAQLVHHESLSRGAEDTPAKKARFKLECDYMKAQWKSLLENDPFYNPNLTLNSSDYDTAKLSRRQKPWTQIMERR